MFENYSECLIRILAYFDLPGNTAWPPQATRFQKLANIDHFWVNITHLLAHFTRNVKCDFFYDFQTRWQQW